MRHCNCSENFCSETNRQTGVTVRLAAVTRLGFSDARLQVESFTNSPATPAWCTAQADHGLGCKSSSLSLSYRPRGMTDRAAGRGSERWVVLTHLQKKFLRCIAVKQQYKYVSQRAGILQIPKKVRKFTDLVYLSFSDHSLECLYIYTATTISHMDWGCLL